MIHGYSYMLCNNIFLGSIQFCPYKLMDSYMHKFSQSLPQGIKWCVYCAYIHVSSNVKNAASV